MQTFGVLGNEFINLYSKENPVLETGNLCYFMFQNMLDYHRPLIAKGHIVDDKFHDGMNKIYYIKLDEIIENPAIVNEFLIGKQFWLNSYSGNIVTTTRKMAIITPFYDFEKNVFPIEAFFVRNSLQKIIDLRIEYLSHIKKDILKQLQDIESI